VFDQPVEVYMIQFGERVERSPQLLKIVILKRTGTVWRRRRHCRIMSPVHGSGVLLCAKLNTPGDARFAGNGGRPFQATAVRP